MKELRVFCDKILTEKDGFRLGEPWKFSATSMGVIVPIIREGGERSYVTLPEVKDKVEFKDEGNISPIKVKNTQDQHLFLRTGTMLEGISGQDRAVITSTIIQPNKTSNVNVRCIHASRPTSRGGGFKYKGYTPRTVQASLRKGQSETWGSVRGYSQALFAMSNAQIGSIKEDNLPKMREAQEKFDKSLQDILEQVPCFENQIGAIIVGTMGVIGIEAFDHADSWKAQYKEAIANYSDELGEKAKESLFTFDETNVDKKIEDFLMLISQAETKLIKDTTYNISLENYLGEVVTLKDDVIHVFAMRKEEKEKPTKSIYQRRPIGYGRPFVDYEPHFPRDPLIVGDRYVQSRTPILFNGEQLRILLDKGMKKGFKEIAREIDKRDGRATWTDLEKGTGLSSATLSTRLKEGTEIGLFGEGFNKGKKVYTLFRS